MCAKILVVDDNTDMCKLLSDLLGNEKYYVQIASSAEDALEKMRGTIFDLIISDISMPGGINGIEFLKKIREMKIDSQVILITAYGSVKTVVEAMNLGALDYIEKPFDWDKFKNLAFQILNEQCRQRSLEKDKLLFYTLNRAFFDTDRFPEAKSC